MMYILQSKTRRSNSTLVTFLLLLWSTLIISVRSESFLRWFDDPKEVVFYSGLLGLFLWQWRGLQKKMTEVVSTDLIFLISQDHLPAFGGSEKLIMRLKNFWNESDSARLNLIQRSWEGLMQSPLWGWGYGSFRFVYPLFFRSGDPNSGYFDPHNSRWIMHPHNEILYQLFESGFVGAILLGSIFLVWVGLLIKRIRNDDHDKKILTLTVLFGLLNIFVIGLVNTSLTHPLIRFEFLMYLVLAVLLVRAAGYALRQGELQRARDLWATAYHEFPYLPQIILEYAKVLTRLGELEKAHALLQKGHELYSFYEPLEGFYQKIVKRLEMEAQKKSQ